MHFFLFLIAILTVKSSWEICIGNRENIFDCVKFEKTFFTCLYLVIATSNSRVSVEKENYRAICNSLSNNNGCEKKSVSS